MREVVAGLVAEEGDDDDGVKLGCRVVDEGLHVRMSNALVNILLELIKSVMFNKINQTINYIYLLVDDASV